MQISYKVGCNFALQLTTVLGRFNKIKHFCIIQEWLHWLVSDIPNGSKIKEGIEKMKFSPSAPPEGSELHRYIFLLFGHKSRIGGKRTSKVNARKGFKIKEYSSENGLGNPAYVNFYYTEKS